MLNDPKEVKERGAGGRWHQGKYLRRGYTTGTCAAAAARAAILALMGQQPAGVPVDLPGGKSAVLQVAGVAVSDGRASAWVIKDAGDDPDVTHGARIEARVRFLPEGITILGGEGVGVVTKPGLAVAPGGPAINPVPMQMIRENAAAVLPSGRGVEITISVPDGERLARQTMNPQLGIVGGISILGTTGIVEPMSEEAFKNSLLPQLDIARAQGLQTLLLTPGRRGVSLARELLGLPAEAVILVSNFFGFMLEEAVRRGFRRVVLWGHVGKLAKIAAGVFQTYNRIGDGRAEVVAALAGIRGASPEMMQMLLEAPTVEAMVTILEQAGLQVVWDDLAARASHRAVLYSRGELQVGTVLFSYDKTRLGCDRAALELLAGAGWMLPPSS